MNQENKSKAEKITDGANIVADKAEKLAKAGTKVVTGLGLLASLIRLITNKKCLCDMRQPIGLFL